MIIVSGMRPTGALHIGHLYGALQNWVKLQEQGNNCYFFVADWHALTSEFKNTELIRENTVGMVMDWLASGIDPEKCTIFVQSHVKEHAELFLLLSQITPLGWLERCPTYKEMKQELPDKDLSNYGFLGYPVLQASDVLLYKAQGVPVGQDQLPHLELIREITRRFNSFYGQVFPEPQSLLSSSPKINGIDGRKMSKSFGNAILLSDSTEEIKRKIAKMVTDEQRKRRQDPGRPEHCNLFPLHYIFSDQKTRDYIDKECRIAGIGCVDDKKILFENMVKALAPIREKRAYYENNRALVEEILRKGAQKARTTALKTMEETRKALNLFI
jgi:tryptophanyl-tRNA synthetase